MTSRRGTFDAMRSRNFALFFSGQTISNTGTWFQNIAISLIVVQETRSASALALVTVVQFAPTFLLAPIAGKISDAVSPKTVLMSAVGVAFVSTAFLAWMVAGPAPNLGAIYALLAVGGVANAFERVAGQAIVFELVGSTRLQNAVVLSTITVAAARSIGPGLAGLAFAAFGAVVCLVINAVSFLVAFAALATIDRSRLHPRIATGSTPAVASTLRTVVSIPGLVVLLVVNIVVTLTALSMNVVITSVVTISFEGAAVALGAAHALNAVGAVVGGLLVTRVRTVAVRALVPALIAFAVTLALNAAAPTLAWFLVAAPVLGIGIGLYQGVLNSAAQNATPPHMLGRVMSLVTQGNIGIAPIGAFLIGLLIDATTGQAAFVLGTAGCLSCAAFVWLATRRSREPRQL